MLPRSTSSQRLSFIRRHCAAAALAITLAVIATPSVFAAGFGGGSAASGYTIETLSTKPWLVTGGNVLVRVGVPNGASLQSTRVTLNGADVTARFMPDDARVPLK